MTNESLKRKSIEIYSQLLKNKIVTISINSKNYPEKLKRLKSPPIAIYIKEEFWTSNVFNYTCTGGENLHVIAQQITNYSNKILNNIFYNNSIKILITNLQSGKINMDIASQIKSKSLINNNCKIINIICGEYTELILNLNKYKFQIAIFNNYSNENIEVIESEIVSVLSDYMILLESGYSKTILKKIDMFLENGKEIFTIPSSIFNKYAILNNYLIKQGCNIITSKEELKLYLTNSLYK